IAQVEGVCTFLTVEIGRAPRTRGVRIDDVVAGFGVDRGGTAGVGAVDIDRVGAVRRVNRGLPGVRAVDGERVVAEGEPNIERFQRRVVDASFQRQAANVGRRQRADLSFIR